ncbi:helix-turn-helix transcriptional regulator [uncultured Clostridium sp.]|jgi:transcriptional regulator with XRE-family HTH domain|uniref:helix-turn-helix domain-containing protein n=1 Tax=uncultured Clostridium sp. TaxID=59620 RepID=UPI002636CCF0|nr:helix-turn-helix transcriptional regulator [uncultured Clostridium sp.]
MNLGSKIKKLRKDLKFTQVELAKKANISRSYLADIENDRYNASLDTLKNISNALDIKLSELLTNDNSQKTENILNEQLLTKLNKLNALGKSQAIKYIDDLSQISKYNNTEFAAELIPIAAHEKEGNFTKEEYQHDIDLMKNDNLWK